jgi:hypothetical protein
MERERVKGVGSTRTNTNHHLLEVLVLLGVLVQTNTKITHGSIHDHCLSWLARSCVSTVPGVSLCLLFL